MADPVAERDQRRATFRSLAEIAHDAFVAYLNAGFNDAQALDLTMLQMSEAFDVSD